MNIKEFIIESYKHHEWWNYYSDNELERCDIEKPSDCRFFIYHFFSVSGKAWCLSTFEEFDDLPIVDLLLKMKPERCQHIVYVFIMGIGIYNKIEKIKELIDKKVQLYSKMYGVKSEVDFIFIWFLCCLFHDLGYVKEESVVLDKEWKCKFSVMKGPIGVPVFYRNTIKNYFKYRQDVNKKIDHGIYAGFSMYNSLCTLRKTQEKYSSNQKLIWEKALEDIYRIASWIVVCHNIWLTGDKNKYKEYHLTALLEGAKKIKFKNTPLFFFFCIIDSIEPIKKMKDISFLDNIELEICIDKIKIITTGSCDIDMKYNKTLNEIGDWLTTIYINENTFEIVLF